MCLVWRSRFCILGESLPFMEETGRSKYILRYQSSWKHCVVISYQTSSSVALKFSELKIFSYNGLWPYQSFSYQRFFNSNLNLNELFKCYLLQLKGNMKRYDLPRTSMTKNDWNNWNKLLHLQTLIKNSSASKQFSHFQKSPTFCWLMNFKAHF